MSKVQARATAASPTRDIGAAERDATHRTLVEIVRRSGVIDDHERQVLNAGGIVIRYGQLYGAGTFYEDRLPPHPRIHIDDAARRTPPLITAGSRVVILTDKASRTRVGERHSARASGPFGNDGAAKAIRAF